MPKSRKSKKRTSVRKKAVKKSVKKQHEHDIKGVSGYCLRCKKKKEMFKVEKPKILRNGAVMLKGECGKCQTKMSAFQKKK